MSVTEREQTEVERANATGRKPVVFVHGLWLLASSWDRWRVLFEEAGYATLAPGWPDDPETVEEARARPEVFANKSLKQATDHFDDVIARLKERPAVVGHSFGGLITQQLAGRGLAAASVAIDPAPFRGVLPLPVSALKSAWAVLGHPFNYARSVPLTFEQFRYAFANAVTEAEARELHEAYAVPSSGVPVFQAAAANLNPFTEVKVDTKSPKRGPMLVISGQRDHTVPWAVANASYKLQKRNPAVTKIRQVPNRGHSLTIDSGWREVADLALDFLKEHVKADSKPARPAVPVQQPARP